jgi:hypothetical protein
MQTAKNEIGSHIAVLLILYVLLCHTWLLELADKVDQLQSIVDFHGLAYSFITFLESINIIDLSKVSITFWQWLISIIF